MRMSLKNWTALIGSALVLSLPSAFAQGGGYGPGANAQSPKPMHLGMKEKIRLHDQDGDNMLSKDEFDAWHDTIYAALDPDGDGFSLEDFIAMRMGPGPKRGLNPDRQKEMQEKAMERKARRFEKMDSDGDEVVTREEFTEFETKVFGEADSNGDGKLSEKEFVEYHRGM